MNAAFQEEFETAPPHSVEAEQAVLGSVLLGALPPALVADDFYRPDHQLIWKAIDALKRADKAQDVVLVFGELETMGSVVDTGGLAYLKVLAENTPTATNVEHYANEVRERARQRRLLNDIGPRIKELIGDGASAAEIVAAVRPKFDAIGQEVAPPGPVVDAQILTFSQPEILAPISPERFILPGVPADAYTLIAGALSSYKTTLLIYLIVWRATGWDLLGLDTRSGGTDVGKSVLVTYEDTDQRIFAKLQRVIQHGYQFIRRQFGEREAVAFIELAAANILRIPLAGKSGVGIVRRREGGLVEQNADFLGWLFAELQSFAPDGALIGLDPLRLAIVGSQNDDDGADVVVQTLNRIATEVPGSGIIVASHTTKSGAQEGAEGYAGAAYATSGSALYSQHARSNFHLARLEAAKIRELFNPNVVAGPDAERQAVARLVHGRLSHGSEGADNYLLMVDGTLTKVEPQSERSAADVLKATAGPLIAAIDHIHTSGLRASAVALEADTNLVRALRGVANVRKAVALLNQNGYLESTGSTRDRNISVTPAGRLLVGGENRGESTEEPNS